jgi:hypothetical protein
MTDEALSQLSVEDKLKVTRYLVADLAAYILDASPDVAKKARHDVSALSMTFGNFYQLVATETPENLKTLQKMRELYGFDARESQTAK